MKNKNARIRAVTAKLARAANIAALTAKGRLELPIFGADAATRNVEIVEPTATIGVGSISSR